MDSQPEWLIVIQAPSATVDGDQLTLEAPSPVGIAFTDRPQRRAQRFETQRYLATWPDTFAGDPPNVAVAWLSDEGEATAVVELGTPRLDATSVTFSFRNLSVDQTGSAFGGTLQHVTLFIDRSSLSITSTSLSIP